MADIVAADFNPPINSNKPFLNPVGMAHLIDFYMHHPYGIQEKLEIETRGLKSSATILAIPTGF
jgi:hypothetical protein